MESHSGARLGPSRVTPISLAENAGSVMDRCSGTASPVTLADGVAGRGPRSGPDSAPNGGGSEASNVRSPARAARRRASSVGIAGFPTETAARVEQCQCGGAQVAPDRPLVFVHVLTTGICPLRCQPAIERLRSLVVNDRHFGDIAHRPSSGFHTATQIGLLAVQEIPLVHHAGIGHGRTPRQHERPGNPVAHGLAVI